GRRIWMNSVDDYVDDFQLLAQALIDSADGLPVFIVGMSMGGGIALRTAVRLQDRPKTAAGVILVSPALRPHRKIAPKCLLAFAPLWTASSPGGGSSTERPPDCATTKRSSRALRVTLSFIPGAFRFTTATPTTWRRRKTCGFAKS
ncbi:MAG: alpha/beta fold hydrolase, partial [Thermoguttaceae bacterium]|nr:alpha/beta fold hydrolase [Thermoguttaceae bacterium]